MSKRHAGFTLIEVMIASAIAVIIVLAVSLIVISQQRTFNTNESIRSMDENLRVASQVLEHAIETAGFGIDPNLAFDFQYYKCDTAVSAAQTPNCVAGTRESAGAGPDELVVYSRDPNYSYMPSGSSATLKGHIWTASASGSPPTSIYLTGNSSATLEKGQVLQVVCAQQTNIYAYVTVGSDTTLTAGTATNVPLLTGDSTNPFKQNVAGAFDTVANSCFAGGASSSVYVFMVNRQHFYIKYFANGRPYLMMDSGLDSTGAVPVASDIEDFQVTYQFGQWQSLSKPAPSGTGAPDSNGDYVLFDAVGENTPIPNDASVSDDVTKNSPILVPFYRTRSFFQRSSSDALRYSATNPDPGAIVGVGVGLIARSPLPDPKLVQERINTSVPALLNRAAFTTTSAPSAYSSAYAFSAYGYLRTLEHLSAPTPNLAARGVVIW